jgi:hypothetical protein
MNSEQCIDLQYSTAAATPTAESDVLVDERAASAGAAEGIEVFSTSLSRSYVV